MEFIFTFIDIKTKLANDHHFLFFVVFFFPEGWNRTHWGACFSLSKLDLTARSV